MDKALPLFDSFYNITQAIFKKCALNAVLIMDKAGMVITVNPAFTQNFGYTDADIAGQDFVILFTEQDKALGRPALELAKVLETGQSMDKNYLVQKDQSCTWVSGETILVIKESGEECMFKIIQDIQAQKDAEDKLTNAHVFNEDILQNIEDIVLIVAEDFRVVKANAAFYNLFHDAAPAQINFKSLIAPYDLQGILLDNVKYVLQDKKVFNDVHFAVSTVHGEKFFNVSGRPLKSFDDTAKALLVVHDVTVQLKSEQEREDVIGFVAHEIRNPLANIGLCNEMMNLMLDEGNTSGLRSWLTKSKSSMVRLNNMISELYDATKFNAGHFTLEPASFNFEEMIEEAIGTIQVLHPDVNIKVDGRISAFVSGDRHRLIQVVTNYLGNAIKYSHGQPEVNIDVSLADSRITVSVADHGMGVSSDQLPHVFERFFRARTSSNREGIGLGLYLCRQIIEAHKGRVWAESEEGKGSVFYFSIPTNL